MTSHDRRPRSRPRLAADEEQHHPRGPGRGLRPAAAGRPDPDAVDATSAPSRRSGRDWLGVQHSVFVNSGSSANLVTLAALQGAARPAARSSCRPITWVSDIAAVLHCGFTPVFVDIDPRTLGMDNEQVLAKITPRTRAVFLTHVLGYNALSQRLLDELRRRGIPLHRGRLRVARGDVRGPQARHVRPGVELLLLLRPPPQHHRRRHGLHQRRRPLRDGADAAVARHGPRAGLRRAARREYADELPRPEPRLHLRPCPATTSAAPRSTPSSAGRSCKRLDDEHPPAHARTCGCSSTISTRTLYQTDFATEGSSNYAFTLILQRAGRRAVRARHGGAARAAASSSAAARPAAATRCASRTCAGCSAPDAWKAVPAGRPRAFLRLLHRQLSVAGARQHPAAVRVAQRRWRGRHSPRAASQRQCEAASGYRSQPWQNSTWSSSTRQPHAGLPVAGHRAGRRREPRLGRADGDLLPHARAVGRDHRRRGRGTDRRPRWPSASRTSTRCWPPWSSTAISRRPRRRS